LNSYYHAGYSPGDHGDHANSPYDAALFPSDPTPEEQAMLAKILDLSPECSGKNTFCSDFDHTLLDATGWPDVILEGAFHADYSSTNEMLAIASDKGIPVVRLRSAYTDEDMTQEIGFIEIIERYEELTRALGVSGARVTAATAHAKATLCAEVEAFKVVALEAQMRGVRALAAYLPAGATAANGDIGGYISSPDKDSVLMISSSWACPSCTAMRWKPPPGSICSARIRCRQPTWCRAAGGRAAASRFPTRSTSGCTTNAWPSTSRATLSRLRGRIQQWLPASTQTGRQTGTFTRTATPPPC
jgi:hypothetical protein